MPPRASTAPRHRSRGSTPWRGGASPTRRVAPGAPSSSPTCRRPIVAATAVAAGLALTLLAPWSGGGAPTLARALAALGPRPVVHVIARTQRPGAPRRVAEIQTETWYDTVHRLLHTIVRRNGK